MAHLGRPKGEKNLEFTLAPVAKYLSKVVGEEVMFIPDVADAEKMVKKMTNGNFDLEDFFCAKDIGIEAKINSAKKNDNVLFITVTNLFSIRCFDCSNKF